MYSQAASTQQRNQAFNQPESENCPKMSLDDYEFMAAIQIGSLRQFSNLKRKRKDYYGASKANGWNLHIEGAAGEAAFAKWANIYWSLGKLRGDDVGQFQVRTRSRHNYDLIIHPDDPDDRVFVLLTGLAPHFRIVGWIWGHEGKDKQFWKDPAGNRPAYFVPQHVLRPISSLPKK